MAVFELFIVADEPWHIYSCVTCGHEFSATPYGWPNGRYPPHSSWILAERPICPVCNDWLLWVPPKTRRQRLRWP